MTVMVAPLWRLVGVRTPSVHARAGRPPRTQRPAGLPWRGLLLRWSAFHICHIAPLIAGVQAGLGMAISNRVDAHLG